MDFSKDEPNAILAKSLSLIARTKSKLKQLDQSNFPTTFTKEAVSLLLEVFEWLEKPINYAPIDPAVLYNRLFAMQELIEIVSDSSSDRIYWPLVSYCDDIWQRLFGVDGPKIFYSLTSEHNYLMLRFSSKLGRDLNGLMPVSEINKLTDKYKMYCLQLASAEDANLQLYANIGHEFGHAIFDHHSSDLMSSLYAHFDQVLDDVLSSLVVIDNEQASRRMHRMLHIVASIAKELFCDLVGVRLMGPSFFLSLYELSWGQDKCIWAIALSPDNIQIQAYPSFCFRLECLFRFGEIDVFCDEAEKDFATVGCDTSKVIPNCLRTVTKDHSTDRFGLWPRDDQDKEIIENVLGQHFSNIKTALVSFLHDANNLINAWYAQIIPQIHTMEIAHLLLRLQNNIPPNIIPDSTLLGKPANFQAVLNASALYRIYLLVGDKFNTDERAQRMTILERLTAKSFEVTFIQQKFNQWENK